MNNGLIIITSLLNCFDWLQAAKKKPNEPSGGAEVHEARSPVLFAREGLQETMNAYCKSYCPSVSQQRMNTYIVQGEKLEELISDAASQQALIKNGKIDLGASFGEISVHQAVVSVMWLLMAKAAVYKEHHTNGAIRMDDPDNKLFSFIQACGDQANNDHYVRISTHMKGKRLDAQYGFDLIDQGLPAEKHTLLYMQLTDGSLFLKLEFSGMPPIRDLSSLFHNIHHSYMYLTTRVKSTAAMKPTRKEHISKAIKKEFTDTMRDLHPPVNRLFKLFASFVSDSKIDQLTKKGNSLGLSEMKDILDNSNEFNPNLTDEQQIKKNKMLETIQEKLSRIEGRNYKGQVKGEEAIVNFGKARL